MEIILIPWSNAHWQLDTRAFQKSVIGPDLWRPTLKMKLAKKRVRVGVVRLVVPIQTQSGANAELLDGEAPGIGLQQGVVQAGRQRKTLSL